MSEKFRGTYRIPSARLPNWDYGSNSDYFVTMCTQGREMYFGKIEDGKMIRSGIGELAHQFWCEIPKHFPFVKLGEFVVMPNHIHGILIFNKPEDKQFHEDTIVETPRLGVYHQTDAASQKWKSGILGAIINQYKRICTINARKIDPGFEWQSRFYDHIIRDDDSFQRISNYIITNPQNWVNDKFYMT